LSIAGNLWNRQFDVK